MALGFALIVATLVVPFFTEYDSLPFFWRFILSPFDLEFALGILIAILFLKRKTISVGMTTGLLIAGFLVLYGIGYATGFDMMNRVAFWGAGGALAIYLACVLGEVVDVKKHIWAKVAEVIGSSTYSIYLVHYPLLVVLMIIFKKTIPDRPLLIGVACFVLAVCAGIFTYYLIERPQQRLVGKLIKKWKAER
jgi:peptidoglycan/LPS O-acetylase OafA/YrhL